MDAWACPKAHAHGDSVSPSGKWAQPTRPRAEALPRWGCEAAGLDTWQGARQGAKVRDLSVSSHWVMGGSWSQHRRCCAGGGFWGVRAPGRAGLTCSGCQ